MKELLKIAGIFAALLMLIPAPALLVSGDVKEPVSGEPMQTDAENESPQTETVSLKHGQELPENDVAVGNDSKDTFRVLDFTSGQVLELELRDYVIGAVLAEMPATYHPEALKAQAVAARTYAVRQREKQRLSPDPELMGADISNDSTKYQAYFTPAQAKEFYGDGYDTYFQKAADAVDGTDKLILFYDGEPIVAAFHAISGGRTESAEVIWGSPVDYLVPADSSADKEAPSYPDEKIFTKKEFRTIIKKAYPDADLSGSAEDWVSIDETSVSGTVTEMTVGDVKLKGTEFRSLFSLRSANFTVSYNEDAGQFCISTKGYGHGVGMSQYGANAMAEDGSDFEEILLHYYKGVDIKEYSVG
ncbi:MAG: stage II sporulation protein D [Oscillospiraceae bacterium]|nr:stage II sporulation protein D [Oscillospiraceae bacterium]